AYITYLDDSVGADPVSDLSAESIDATEAASSLPSDCPVVSHSGWGKGCFHRHGDHIYVLDTTDNGHAAYVYFENYLRTSSGNWQKHVSGACTPYDVGIVPYCALHFYEHTTLNAYGRHRIRLLTDNRHKTRGRRPSQRRSR